MPTPPALSIEQRRQANLLSTATRQARKALKAELASGNTSFPLATERAEAQGMKVASLIAALPGLGPKTAAKMLTRLGINVNHTLAQCGPRQVQALLAELAKREPPA